MTLPDTKLGSVQDTAATQPFPWPAGSATGVGSMPGTDRAEAIAMVLGELPDLPYLPELPGRGPGADLTGRTAALLVDMPAETTIAPRTPTAAHSPTTPGTVAAGVAITARSTGSGTSAMVGYALIPSTFARFGLTGNTVPPNGLPIRFQSTVRPTLPAFSLAPTTATDRGANSASSGLRRVYNTSCAWSTGGFGRLIRHSS